MKTDTNIVIHEEHLVMPGIRVQAAHDRCLVTLASGQSAAIWTNLGWRTILDGSYLVSPGDSTLRLDFGSLIKVRDPSAKWQLLELSDAPTAGISFARIRSAVWGAVAPFSASVSVHMLLFLLCTLLYKVDFNIAGSAEVEVTQELHDVIFAQSLAGGGGEYSGSRSWDQRSAEEKAEAQAAQTAKITSRLSGLADRIASIKLSGFKIKVGQNTMGGDLNAKISALGAHAGKGTSLSGQIQRLASDNGGSPADKSMKWNLVGAAGVNLTTQDQGHIAEILNGLSEDLRDCYEKALLIDETMAVTAKIEIEIGGTGRFMPPQYNLMGQSTPESEEKLTSCISGVFSKVQVGKSFAGIIVKKQFIFR